MGTYRIVLSLAATVLIGAVAAPAQAQEVCGGVAGIPCSDPAQFCLLPDGSCCCDFEGVCTDVPEACTADYDPVCGCDGVTYSNRCTAERARMSIDHTGPCEGTPPTVNLTAFTPFDRLFWDPLPQVFGYNVYVRDMEFAPPVFDGECLYHTVPENSVLLRGEPDPGRAWMFQVTGRDQEGEGPMGCPGCPPRSATPCTCTLPADVGPCDGVFPRWYFEPATGVCEQFVWGGCEGNANNFPSQAECEGACLSACDQPAVQGPCGAAFPRWYHNVLTGRCEPFVWGGCGGNANNFASIEQCRTTCGDVCLLPPDPGDCDGKCPRWYYDAATGQCRSFTWGCCGGNANNFATPEQCRAACGP